MAVHRERTNLPIVRATMGFTCPASELALLVSSNAISSRLRLRPFLGAGAKSRCDPCLGLHCRLYCRLLYLCKSSMFPAFAKLNNIVPIIMPIFLPAVCHFPFVMCGCSGSRQMSQDHTTSGSPRWTRGTTRRTCDMSLPVSPPSVMAGRHWQTNSMYSLPEKLEEPRRTARSHWSLWSSRGIHNCCLVDNAQPRIHHVILQDITAQRWPATSGAAGQMALEREN
jgi:hypothetical protein